MDWTTRLNEVMDYVEEHIHTEISEQEISILMACPYEVFQGAFSQIAGVSFSEYVRRRKLTLAAYDLQNTTKTILDIALDYGYQSPDAFRVAFKSLHHVTPSELRTSSPTLTFYCKLHFQITIQGLAKMNYTIYEDEGFDVVGVRMITPYGGGTWGVVKTDGSNEKIHALTGQYFDLGLCFGFLEDGSNDYMCAVKYQNSLENDFTTYHFPATTWLKFEAIGKISDNVLMNIWHQINTAFLPSSRFHKGPLPTIEKYTVWDEVQDFCHVEILIPQ